MIASKQSRRRKREEKIGNESVSSKEVDRINIRFPFESASGPTIPREHNMSGILSLPQGCADVESLGRSIKIQSPFESIMAVEEFSSYITSFLDLPDFLSISLIIGKEPLITAVETLPDRGEGRTDDQSEYLIVPSNQIHYFKGLTVKSYLERNLYTLIKGSGWEQWKFSGIILDNFSQYLSECLSVQGVADMAIRVSRILGQRIFYSSMKEAVIDSIFLMKNVHEAIRLMRTIGFLRFWTPEKRAIQYVPQAPIRFKRRGRGRRSLLPKTLFPPKNGDQPEGKSLVGNRTPLEKKSRKRRVGTSPFKSKISNSDDPLQGIGDMFGTRILHKAVFSSDRKVYVDSLSGRLRMILIHEILDKARIPLDSFLVEIIERHGLDRDTFIMYDNPKGLHSLLSIIERQSPEKREEFLKSVESFSAIHNYVLLSHGFDVPFYNIINSISCFQENNKIFSDMAGAALNLSTKCGIISYLILTGSPIPAGRILWSLRHQFDGRYIIDPIITHSVGGLGYADVRDYFEAMNNEDRLTEVCFFCEQAVRSSDGQYTPISDYVTFFQGTPDEEDSE